jgi:long-subunit fatty acid transport protein
MASAYAGAAATSNDASYLAYNSATAATTGGGDVALSFVAILPDSSASYSTALTSAEHPREATRPRRDLFAMLSFPTWPCANN